jgi:hypothetical protein
MVYLYQRVENCYQKSSMERRIGVGYQLIKLITGDFEGDWVTP